MACTTTKIPVKVHGALKVTCLILLNGVYDDFAELVDDDLTFELFQTEPDLRTMWIQLKALSKDHKQLQLTDELKPKVFFVSGHNDNVLSIEVHTSTRMHELVDADFIHWYRRSDGDMPPLQYVHVYGNNQQVNEVDCLFKNMEGLSAWGDQQPVAWLAQPFLRDMKVQGREKPHTSGGGRDGVNSEEEMNEVKKSLTPPK